MTCAKERVHWRAILHVPNSRPLQVGDLQVYYTDKILGHPITLYADGPSPFPGTSSTSPGCGDPMVGYCWYTYWFPYGGRWDWYPRYVVDWCCCPTFLLKLPVNVPSNSVPDSFRVWQHLTRTNRRRCALSVPWLTTVVALP
jgi:hypothetical protein